MNDTNDTLELVVVPQVMKRDDFFRGLLAALRLSGLNVITTRDDAHHEAFRHVVEVLDEIHDDCPEIPDTFVPSPFTGRYRELDNALVRFQQGLLGAQNPFYPCVNLDITDTLAKRIMNEYTPKQQQIFTRLASVWSEKTEVAS